MEFEVTALAPEASLVTLRGRMDVAGCEKVELPFTAAVASAGKHAILDLSQVAFVGSLGIRLLVNVARVLQRRERKLVMCGVQPAVREVFETVSLDQMIPILASQAEAKAQLGL